MRLFSLPPVLRRHSRDGMAAPDNRRTGQKEFSKRADQREKSLHSVLVALLPAYIALLAAISSGIYALAYEVASPEFTWKIWFVLFAAVSFSYISRCGKRSVQRLYGWLMVLFIIALPFLAIQGHSFSLVPTDSVADSNTVVAVLMGWLAIASVFLVGARYGSSPVPFTAPLVPTISLFGLLNSISVNTVVSVSFLTFVIASLYLVAYERMLNQEHILDVLGQGTHSQGAVGDQNQTAAPGSAFAGAAAVASNAPLARNAAAIRLMFRM